MTAPCPLSSDVTRRRSMHHTTHRSVLSASEHQKVTNWETRVTGLSGYPDGRDVTELVPATTMMHLMRKYRMPTVDLLKVSQPRVIKVQRLPCTQKWRCLSFALKRRCTDKPFGRTLGHLGET